MNISELQQKFSRHYKLTKQREIIFNTLKDAADHHLSAEDIYEIVRRDNPDIGLATIYRTLELLSRLEILQKLDFGDGRQRYELCGDRPHPHLICMCCGKVFEMNETILDKLSAALEDVKDFRILDYRLYFYGYCKICRPSTLYKL